MATNAGFTVEDSKFDTSGIYQLQNVRKGAGLNTPGDVLSTFGGGMTDGTVVEVWLANGNPVQNWKAELDDEEEVPRGHTLSPQGPSTLKIVMTLKSHHQNNKVVLEEYKGKLEQLWFLIPLASNGNYSIVSAYNGKALSNQGRSENVRCVEIDPDDVNQQWRYNKI